MGADGHELRGTATERAVSVCDGRPCRLSLRRHVATCRLGALPPHMRWSFLSFALVCDLFVNELERVVSFGKIAWSKANVVAGSVGRRPALPAVDVDEVASPVRDPSSGGRSLRVSRWPEEQAGGHIRRVGWAVEGWTEVEGGRVSNFS
jgi:hypothetical protein